MKKLSLIMSMAFVFTLFLAAGSFAAGMHGTGGSSSSGSDYTSSPGSSSTSSPQGDTSSSSMRSSQSQTGSMQTAQKASDFIGKTVQGRTGEDIGQVNDLVVDPATGRVSYAILSASGISGASDKLYPVPFTALKPRPGQEALSLNIDSSRLQSAPSFDRNNWPDLSNPRWSSDVDRFYSDQTQGGSSSPGSSSGSMPGSSPSTR
jgi:sporulation protein YlmC with PRC-barrel domain